MTVRPTGRGLALGLTGLVLLAGALVLGYPGLGVVAAASLGALLLGLLQLLPSTGLQVTRTLEPARTARGGVVLGMIDVVNAGRRGSPPVQARDTAGPERVDVDLPALPPSGRHRATYQVPTTRRGVYPVGPLVLERFDPLGLLHRPLPTGKVLQLFVHPRTVAVRPPAAGRALDLEGQTADVDVEGGTAFHALRPYVMGDDLRQVHWRTVARTGELVVRRTMETSRPQTAVLLDDRPGSWDGDAFEVGVEVAASVLLACVRAALPAGLLLAGGRELTAVGGELAPLLDDLALVQADADDARPLPVATLSSTADGGCAVVVTGRADPEAVAALAPLAARLRRLVLVVAMPSVEDAARPAVPPGVEVLLVSDVDDFARAWGQA